MIITDISGQAKNPDKVNIFIDGSFTYSLFLQQVVDLGIKVGMEVDTDMAARLEQESAFGRLYVTALAYALTRPRSMKEMREYLYKYSRERTVKTRAGTAKKVPPVAQDIIDRVLDRLVEKNYVDDRRFAEHWVEYRHRKKGVSMRVLEMELRGKGIVQDDITAVLASSDRSDATELRKMIDKKSRKYPDEQKLIQYLMRQGFSYEDIRTELSNDD